LQVGVSGKFLARVVTASFFPWKSLDWRNDINPHLFPPLTPLAPHRNGWFAIVVGESECQYGTREAVLRAIFPRRQYGASRDATGACICISCTHDGPAPHQISFSLSLSLSLSHYRGQTALFWIIDCTQMRCNETRNRIAMSNICGLATVARLPTFVYNLSREILSPPIIVIVRRDYARNEISIVITGKRGVIRCGT